MMIINSLQFPFKNIISNFLFSDEINHGILFFLIFATWMELSVITLSLHSQLAKQRNVKSVHKIAIHPLVVSLKSINKLINNFYAIIP